MTVWQMWIHHAEAAETAARRVLEQAEPYMDGELMMEAAEVSRKLIIAANTYRGEAMNLTLSKAAEEWGPEEECYGI